MGRRATVRVVAGTLALGVAVLAGWGVVRTVASPASSADPSDEDDADGSGPARGAGIAARHNDSAARRVRAHIVDDDGEPLEGGRVSLRCLHDDEVTAIAGSAWSLDEAGGFEAPGCLGVVCVELHHPSAVPADTWVLQPGEPAVLRTTTLPRLHGTVVDPRGAPIAAARVTVRAPDEGDVEAIVPTIGTTTTTDADGGFSFALVRRAPCDPCTEVDRGCEEAPLALHDRVVVGVHAPRFAPARVEVEVDAEAGDAEIPAVRMVPPADVLTGTLRDPRGDAYPRATVLARSSADPSEQHQAECEGDRFEFGSLGAGPYDLRAIQDGVELATAADIEPGDDIELTGRPIAAGPDVELEVLLDGVPHAGVTVDGGPFRGVRTDLDGRARAAAAMPGAYTLSLRPPGAAAQRRAITVPTAEVPQPPRTPTGAPPPGQTVHLRVDLGSPTDPRLP